MKFGPVVQEEMPFKERGIPCVFKAWVQIIYV